MIILEGFDPAMLLTSNLRLHWHTSGARTAYWRGLGATACLRAIDAGLAPMERARIVFTLRFPTAHRRDANNWWPTAKAVIDGMVTDAELLPDDSSTYLIGPDMRIDPERGPHRISIDIQATQPDGLGDKKVGNANGKKGGVHSGRTRQRAEGPRGPGLHGGSGVLDHPGPDSPRAPGRADRGLTETPSPGSMPGEGISIVIQEAERG